MPKCEFQSDVIAVPRPRSWEKVEATTLTLKSKANKDSDCFNFFSVRMKKRVVVDDFGG